MLETMLAFFCKLCVLERPFFLMVSLCDGRYMFDRRVWRKLFRYWVFLQSLISMISTGGKTYTTTLRALQGMGP
uniref:Uncharacterized protein n=1 Tax=Pararge aegeria TaxID=116150 RepID=S4NTQ8_9NEOP